MGPPGGYCTACHHDANVTMLAAPHASIPGHPRWQLAPREMAWENKTLGEICRQLKDHPGAGRQPAPGTQQMFGALIQVWIDTGAACP